MDFRGRHSCTWTQLAPREQPNLFFFFFFLNFLKIISESKGDLLENHFRLQMDFRGRHSCTWTQLAPREQPNLLFFFFLKIKNKNHFWVQGDLLENHFRLGMDLRVGIVVLEHSWDIVDTCFHTSQEIWYNSTKQAAFPCIWGKGWMRKPSKWKLV
jgi:hypothetical protein